MNMPTHIMAKPIDVETVTSDSEISVLKRVRHGAIRSTPHSLHGCGSIEDRIGDGEDQSKPGQAEAERQCGDLSNDDEIVWMRENAIGAVRHERRARKDDDARGPTGAERRQNPDAQNLQRQKNCKPDPDRSDASRRKSTDLRARARASARSPDSARAQTRARPSQAGPRCCGAPDQSSANPFRRDCAKKKSGRPSRGSLQGNATRGETRPHRCQQCARRQAGANDTLQHEKRGRRRHVAVVRQDGAFMVERRLARATKRAFQRGDDLRAAGMTSEAIDIFESQSRAGQNAGDRGRYMLLRANGGIARSKITPKPCGSIFQPMMSSVSGQVC